MHIKIQTEDGYIFRKTKILSDLYDAHHGDQDVEIDLNTEGNCARNMGLYDLLDEFCQRTGYNPTRIKIRTASMIEKHPDYQIVKEASYWYEVPLIKQWAKENDFQLGTKPTKHFSCFIGQSKWARLWVSAWLYHNHPDKTLQTFHNGFGKHYRTRPEDGIYDWLDLDNLNQHSCDLIPEVIEFLRHCPMKIEHNNTATKNTNTIFDQPKTYPIQHPANLGIIGYYEDTFCDIVVETSVGGNAFLATEKLWRCMLAKRPFVVISNPDYLYHLHQLGFKTFWNWWDESYDGFENRDRVVSVLKVLDEISHWPVAKIQKTLQDMESVLEHNKNRFLSFDLKELHEVFDE